MNGRMEGRKDTVATQRLLFHLSKNAQRGQVSLAKRSFAHREFQAFRSFRLAHSVTNRDIYVSSCSDILAHEKEHGIPQQKVHI